MMLCLHGHKSRGLAPWQPSHKLPATSQNISPCDAARNKCAVEAVVEGLVMMMMFSDFFGLQRKINLFYILQSNLSV